MPIHWWWYTNVYYIMLLHAYDKATKQSHIVPRAIKPMKQQSFRNTMRSVNRNH